jgi:hypothetical protein
LDVTTCSVIASFTFEAAQAETETRTKSATIVILFSITDFSSFKDIGSPFEALLSWAVTWPAGPASHETRGFLNLYTVGNTGKNLSGEI